jgi:hypothetical protein
VTPVDTATVPPDHPRQGNADPWAATGRPGLGSLLQSLLLCCEKVTDSFDRLFWYRLLLEFAFERVDERLIRQLFADAGKLLGEGVRIAAMEVCFDVFEVSVRRSCNYISGIREPAAVEFDCEK